MNDIVDRIRKVETTPLNGTESWVDLWEVLQDARAEIVSLREAIRRLADQDATLSVQGGNVIVEMDATLTDAEREAVKAAMELVGTQTIKATLRGMLERLR